MERKGGIVIVEQYAGLVCQQDSTSESENCQLQTPQIPVNFFFSSHSGDNGTAAGFLGCVWHGRGAKTVSGMVRQYCPGNAQTTTMFANVASSICCAEMQSMKQDNRTFSY